MSSVWAWVEGDPEVMGDAADLAGALGVEAVGVAAGAGPAALFEAGADRVFVVEAAYDAETHSGAIAACVETPPCAVLLPGTADGSDLAPRLAAHIDAACLLDCAWVRAHRGGLLACRWAHDDRAQERWLVPEGLPLVATVRPGSRGAPWPRPRRAEAPVAAPGPRARARLLRRLPPEPRSIRLAEADRIVAAGMGIGSRDMLPAVQDLADLLGAALGASRPLADRGWVPFDRQVGTTGQRVAPSLYLAVGISGALQHLGGIGEVRTVIAINTDPACPMMARATLAAVGDAREVVPALNRLLRERSG